YVKRIRLARGAPGFSIDRTLKNTGKRLLSTEHYCHHFTLLDDHPVGPDYRLSFPYRLAPSRPARGPGRAEDPEICSDAFAPGESFYGEFTGFDAGRAGQIVTISNTRTGTGLEIRGSMPLSQLHVWGVSTAICPEPFVALRLTPGQSRSWSND